MGKDVLLCDDEVIILRAAECKLRSAGLNVRTVNNGEQAWREIERSRPDIVVTDLQMPPQLDALGSAAAFARPRPRAIFPS